MYVRQLYIMYKAAVDTVMSTNPHMSEVKLPFIFAFRHSCVSPFKSSYFISYHLPSHFSHILLTSQRCKLSQPPLKSTSPRKMKIHNTQLNTHSTTTPDIDSPHFVTNTFVYNIKIHTSHIPIHCRGTSPYDIPYNYASRLPTPLLSGYHIRFISTTPVILRSLHLASFPFYIIYTNTRIINHKPRAQNLGCGLKEGRHAADLSC